MSPLSTPVASYGGLQHNLQHCIVNILISVCLLLRSSWITATLSYALYFLGSAVLGAPAKTPWRGSGPVTEWTCIASLPWKGTKLRFKEQEQKKKFWCQPKMYCLGKNITWKQSSQVIEFKCDLGQVTFLLWVSVSTIVGKQVGPDPRSLSFGVVIKICILLDS